jgi:aminomethyltransferase
MVPFAGYSLPVQYPAGVLKSHLHTRADNCASLFDVGHMGQLKWFGKDRAEFLEKVCLADVQGMAPGASALTLITLPSGGILDDSIVSNHSQWGYQCVFVFAIPLGALWRSPAPCTLQPPPHTHPHPLSTATWL